MRGFYFLHVATGVILIGLLVAFYNLRSENSGRSGVIGSEPAVNTLPAGILPPRAEDVPLTFTNHLGEKTSDRDFRGRHALVFFGYSSCPDICPGNLVAMKQAIEGLGDEADLVQPVFISFDPARDTPERLANYVKHFHPKLIGLTGTPEEIDAATRAYGVFYELGHEGEDHPGEIHHSSNTYLIGPDGKAKKLFRHNTPPEEMTAVMRAELARSETTSAAALP